MGKIGKSKYEFIYLKIRSRENVDFVYNCRPGHFNNSIEQQKHCGVDQIRFHIVGTLHAAVLFRRV